MMAQVSTVREHCSVRWRRISTSHAMRPKSRALADEPLSGRGPGDFEWWTAWPRCTTSLSPIAPPYDVPRLPARERRVTVAFGRQRRRASAAIAVIGSTYEERVELVRIGARAFLGLLGGSVESGLG
jgi:hypothetical protein